MLEVGREPSLDLRHGVLGVAAGSVFLVQDLGHTAGAEAADMETMTNTMDSIIRLIRMFMQ